MISGLSEKTEINIFNSTDFTSIVVSLNTISFLQNYNRPSERFENLGAQLVKEAASKTNEVAEQQNVVEQQKIGG